MRKTINLIGIIIISILFGCSTKETKIRDANILVNDNPIIVFDSCEYITWKSYGGTTNITHKGNCKLCVNRLKNIIENSNKK